jgi:predicted SAM-dependent methyltransferase
MNWDKDCRLDLGCGVHKTDGYKGVDIVAFEGVDYVYDLTKFPYPAEDESINRIISKHTLEHFEWKDVIKIMNECHRILKKDAELEVIVPLFPSETAVDDPDHHTMFTTETFGRFEPENEFAYEIGVTEFWRRIQNNWTPQCIPTETSEGLQLLYPKRRELHCILKRL